MIGVHDTSQIFIYLSQVEWKNLASAAAAFMEPDARIIEHNATSLEIVAPWANLRAERFVLRPELLPWEVELSLTLFRGESPLDPWLTLQFAHDFAKEMNCAAWSDPPQLALFPNNRWKIKIDGASENIQSYVVELLDHDIDWMEVKKETPTDLRNFELHQTRLPYGKPRPAKNVSEGL